MSGEVIMYITYGIEVQPQDDSYITTAEQALRSLSAAAIPGRFIVDSVPAFKYVPAWMPFAGFQRKAKEWKELASAMIHSPYEAIKDNIVCIPLHSFCLCHIFLQKNGNMIPSFVSDNLEITGKADSQEHRESIIRAAAGTMYTGEDSSLSC